MRSERLDAVVTVNGHAVSCHAVGEGDAIAGRHYRPAFKLISLPLRQGDVRLPRRGLTKIGCPPTELARRGDDGLILMQYRWNWVLDGMVDDHALSPTDRAAQQ